MAVGKVIILTLLMLQGCAQVREREYYEPKKPHKCEIPVYVDGQFHHCTTHRQIDKELKE